MKRCLFLLIMFSLILSCEYVAPFSATADLSAYPGYTFDITVLHDDLTFINKGEEIMLPYRYYRIHLIIFDDLGVIVIDEKYRVNHNGLSEIVFSLRPAVISPITVVLSKGG